MADEPFNCAQCGAKLTAHSRFCGSCGHVVVPSDRKTEPGVSKPPAGQMGRTKHGLPVEKSDPPPAVADELDSEAGAESDRSPTQRQEFAKTMLGVTPSGKPASPVKAAQVAAASGGQKTMLGLPQGLGVPVPPGGDPMARLESVLGGAEAGALARTQPGVAPASDPPAGADPLASTASGVAPDRNAADPLARTQLGIAPDSNAPAGADPLASTARGLAPQSPAPTPLAQTVQGVAPDSNAPGGKPLSHTMLGIAPASDAPAPADERSDVTPLPPANPSSRPPSLAHTMVDMGSAPLQPGIAPAGGRTMLGVGLQAPVAEPARAPVSAPIVDYADSTGGSLAPAGVGRGSSTLLVVGVLLVMAAVVAGAYFYLTQGGSSNVRARVVRGDDGEQMLFEVPGAADGVKLRFGGQEQPLEAGVAKFPLAADSLRVGSNAVLVEVVSPGGEIESARILLEVDYRVTVDSAPLRAGEAAVDVVVSALPGSKVLLDGKSIALDEEGRAVRHDALELGQSSTEGVIEHTVSYRIEPPEGEASVGELTTRIPVTLMQIDKPGLSLVTDRPEVDIAGAVGSGARVSIDGKPVEVNDGRFLYSYLLPAPGEYKPKVMAVVDGRAPNVVQLDLRRVEDLEKAARGFKPEPGLSYAKIAQNPAIYRGRKVAFDARIYNIKVENGRTVLQALVRECPKGQACSLWVTYPAATDLTKQSWVRVLGTVAGEQQFRSEQDKVRSVPKVDAAFLLPTEL